jgi:hypothetical protein
MLLDGWNISFGIYIPARDCESVDSLHDKRKVLECRDRRRQLAHTQTRTNSYCDKCYSNSIHSFAQDETSLFGVHENVFSECFSLIANCIHCLAFAGLTDGPLPS